VKFVSDPLQHRGGPLEAHAGVDIFSCWAAAAGCPAGRPRDLNCVKTRFPDSDLAEIGVVIDSLARAETPSGPAGGIGGQKFRLRPAARAAPTEVSPRRANAGGLVVVEINGGREPLGVESSHCLLVRIPTPSGWPRVEVVAELKLPASRRRCGDRRSVRRCRISPVRRHFWQVVARGEFEFAAAEEVVLELVHAAGVNSTVGSQRGRARRWPPDAALRLKKVRYFSRNSSAFMDIFTPGP